MISSTTTSNPYDFYYEVRDPALFAGRREELTQLDEEVARLASVHPIAPMVAIVGERRIGKTSISLRMQESCEKHEVLALRVTLTGMTAADPWEFWHEIFYGLLHTARDRLGSPAPNLGFPTEAAQTNLQFSMTENHIAFFSAYATRTSSMLVPHNHLVYEGLRSLINAITGADFNGVLLIIDEAHLLVDKHVLTQQLRSAIREAGRCGVVLVGETELSQLFADRAQPLFAQGRVIPLGNFPAQSDIAECALLPLAEDARRLMSPMTIDYLIKLSQGKPNQIRLICHSIYDRYQKGQQADLNITIEALDNVLDSISATYTEYDVRQKVEAIRRLSSVDLETLYNMTRYPNWSIADIVELDESFRAEGRSLAATSRREETLKEKREKFVGLGLMVEDSHRSILAGDEFLALYLRFWYEIRKHGQLSRSLVLGKGPATPFGEKTEKLVRFIAWELKRRPAIVKNTFSANDASNEDPVEAVKVRFSALDDLLAGNPVRLDNNQNVVYEWFSTCELVRRPGPHHLLCLSVRNLENLRETVQVELYFDSAETPLIIPAAMLNDLRQRADDSKILIEGWDNFTATLPTLSGLLEAIGGPQLEEITAEVGSLARWRIESVQHYVGGGDGADEGMAAEPDDNDEEEPEEWVQLYENSNFIDAENAVSRSLASDLDRRKSARLYNDRGYIRYRMDKKEEAKRDLQRGA